MGKKGSFIKRFTDILISILTIVITSPVLILAAIAIKLESRGPVLFKHERTGYNGQKFLMYKFRGMVKNALELGPELTQVNDPRITKVGKILRRTSIDEIPQVINVLKGEMSIVGPRPEITSITSKYTEEQRKIFEFIPGITGYSQINGRQRLTPEQRVKMEVDYYTQANVFTDFIVLLKTFEAIATNHGNL
ncbi:MAG: sugar transferase [Sphingobacteriaceae bacterium]|nr:sugar transferase [Sphingobacteriaceae bacterium]